MGLFSKIGDIFGDAVDFVGDALGGVGSFIDPFLGLIGAGTNIYSAYSAQQGAESANAMTAAQAALNRQFQAEQTYKQYLRYKGLADTSFQRGVADMKAAGLNPILAYSKGGAASAMPGSPSGAMAQFQNPNAQSAQILSQTANSALGLSKLQAEVNQIYADIGKIESEVEKNETISNLNRVLRTKNFAEIKNVNAQHQVLRQTITNMGISESKLRNELYILMKQADFSRITTEMLKKNPDLRTLAALMEVLGVRTPMMR